MNPNVAALLLASSGRTVADILAVAPESPPVPTSEPPIELPAIHPLIAMGAAMGVRIPRSFLPPRPAKMPRTAAELERVQAAADKRERRRLRNLARSGGGS